jgi:hypothetical protein
MQSTLKAIDEIMGRQGIHRKKVARVVIDAINDPNPSYNTL